MRVSDADTGQQIYMHMLSSSVCEGSATEAVISAHGRMHLQSRVHYAAFLFWYSTYCGHWHDQHVRQTVPVLEV